MDLQSNPLAHRAILSVPHAPTLFQDVRRISSEWLIDKFGKASLTSGHHRLDEVSVLTNHVAYRPDGTEHAIRLQLREDKPEATWRTTITALATEESTALVAVSLEAFPNGNAPLTPGRPRVVGPLVHDLRPTDGPVPLTLDPQAVHAGDVAALIDVLCDPERTKPVIVLARPSQPHPLWSERVGKVIPHCAGAASLYRLEDLDAVEAFRAEIGEDHRVAPGSVRTFLTDVDPGWPKDAPRHRFLTMARITDPRDLAWRGIARTAQRLSTEGPLPDALRTLSFPDDAGRRRREERQAVLAAARASDELAVLHREVEEYKALLAQAEGELNEATRSAELSARTTASLERQLQEAVQQVDGYMEDALRALDDVERARAEADILRRRLREAGRYEDTVVVKRPAGAPDTFQDLWDRLTEFEDILVTADRDTACGLDESDRARAWVAKAWSALRALDSYARMARDGFSGGFREHCRSSRPGAGMWPSKQFSVTEGQTTKNRWGAERVFPVPTEVDPCGRAEMLAHLKLEHKGSTSPRIHILDDTKGATGRVIVGYIGPHLTNTKTN